MKLLFLITLFVIAQRTKAAFGADDDLFAMFSPEEYNSTLHNGNQTIGEYRPRSYVKRFHSCPHVGRDLRIIENPKFFGVPSEKILEKRHGHLDPGIKDQSDAYLESLLFFPILLGFIGLLAIVGLDLGIDGYFSPWLVPHLGPVEMDPDEDTITSRALIVHQNEGSRKNWLSYYCIAVFLALCATNFVFIGNGEFDSGYRKFKEQVSEIGDDLFTISSGVNLLFTDLESCKDLVNQASTSTCPEAQAAIPLIGNLESQLHAFESQVETIGEYVLDVNDEIKKKIDQKDIYIYTIYSLSMAMIFVLVIISFFTNSNYMKYTVYAAQFAVVVLIVQSSFYVFAMMFLSDFCMNPMESVYRSMNGLGLIQQTAKYYGFCRGLNPIHRNLAQSYAIRDTIGNFLVNLFDYQTNPSCECRSDRTTIDAFRALQAMHVLYESLASLMDCYVVHEKWIQIYDVSLCDNTITGLLALWINGWFSCLGMFLVAISASVLMLYFDDAWNQVQINQEIVDQKRRDHEKSGKYAAISSSETDRSEVSDTGSDSDSDANVRV